MAVPPDPDGALDDLAARPFETEGDFLAALAEATLVINGATPAGAGVAATRLVGARDAEERLQERIGRLFDLARRGAEHFDAAGFSITVGFPLGVSVTVDFRTKAAEPGGGGMGPGGLEPPTKEL